MSHSLRSLGSDARRETERVVEIEGRDAVQDVLDALDDPDCRAILEATAEEPLTATEIADRCDVPISSAYRKLNLLTDARLLEERTRLRKSGQHTGEYAPLVDDVSVSVSDEGGIVLEVSYRRTESHGGDVLARN